MNGTEGIGPYEWGFDPTPLKGLVLAFFMWIILSGTLPFFSYYLRGTTWGIWVVIYAILFSFSRELPLRRLMLPILPYLIWLVFYLVWALIVSPVTDIAFALKVAITTSTLACCMAVLTAKPLYLRSLANFAQFAVAANLALFYAFTHSGRVSNLVIEVTQHSEAFITGTTRYGGFYGNPNMVGYICLVAIILSVMAVPWVAWMGRLCSLPLFYLAASRKSAILFICIFILYLLIVQRRNYKFWLASGSIVFLLGMSYLLNDSLKAKSFSSPQDPILARLMDVQEKDTEERGGETRLDLLHKWTANLAGEPWYGYGLQAMAGTIYDEKDPEKVVLKGVYPLGTHNTYLGVWVDIGPIGFIAFLLMLAHYARKCLLTGGDPITRWVLTSFLLVNLATLMVSHNHLFCFEGKVSFTLFFILPSCYGLRAMGHRLTQHA